MLGTKIKQLRELLGKTQEEIATQLKITPQAYSRIERNEVSLSLERLEQISEIFGIKSSIIADFDPTRLLHLLNEANPIASPTIHITVEDYSKNETIKLLSKIIEGQYQEIKQLRTELQKNPYSPKS